ncbi:alpha/beta hydrolase [Yinghuangia seranimata]|uniref:alpha/beta hydrolase n=1 Tax=Yinghuangia seranimata TaxID=408067 RepID=UPI00248C978D|nr:alpha/beta hydrolase [Yinghuangia seranimata]MDI2129411.1 alpha/beta hydrolase [Yinghuangia seranimata]
MNPQANQLVLVPELAAIMAAVPPLPVITEDSVAAIRQRVVEAAGRQPRPDLHAVADRLVPGPAGDIPVRVYRPVDADDLPVLVFAHGGGWAICGIETHDGLCREIANRSGCLVVSVEYRLAPEHVFPAAAEDFYAAARWVAEHAREIGGDPDRVAVGGDSAGANLAAVAGLMARDRGGPRFAFQLLAYPGLDAVSERPSATENADAPMLNRASSQSMWRAYAGGADLRDPYLSPLHADDLAGLPPGLIVTAQYDMGRDDAHAYAASVGKAGGAVEVLEVQGAVHGFLSYYAQVPAASGALDHACAALRAAVADPGSPYADRL